ncbi:rhodanese-like domain-containing protein [Desulfopila inferna]|uniref:rhodanese-like domain-containing protein n=1 Tax=Desulfopila inferna TaxID=468528 RepID=UPI00307D9CEE
MRRVKRVSSATAMCICLAAFVLSGFSFGTNKFKEELKKEEAAVKLLREVERGDYQIVTTEELQQILNSKEDVLLIDTMPYEASYKKGHIPSAEQFLFPIAEMEQWSTEETDNKTSEDFERLLGPDRDKKIIIYCGFVKCTRSHNGALWARKLGYTNVYRHPGGIYAWKGAGFKINEVP